MKCDRTYADFFRKVFECHTELLTLSADSHADGFHQYTLGRDGGIRQEQKYHN
jgi:hypothetical protein